MFEKYSINDLFLAIIDVDYPNPFANDISEDSVNVGGVFSGSGGGYGYLTILKKDNDHYVDLQNLEYPITDIRNPRDISYTIEYMEPLSNYYTQDGKKLSRRKAIKLASQYYDSIHENNLERLSKSKNLK